MARLKSTRGIMENRLKITVALLRETESHLNSRIQRLEGMRGPLKRASRPKTLERFANDLRDESTDLGYQFPNTYNKKVLLDKINLHIRTLVVMKSIAVDEAHVYLCGIYEDFVRRVVLKYYEDDPRRLNDKARLSNKEIVEALERGENIHRTLADKVADIELGGGLANCYESLNRMKLQVIPSIAIKELFLLRNCIVHNGRKVSPSLSQVSPTKYKLHSRIRLNTNDFDEFKDQVHQSILFVISKFSDKYPVPGKCWHVLQPPSSQAPANT